MDNRFDLRRFFAYLGIVLFLLLAIAVPLGLVGPTKPDTSGYDSAVKSALAEATANEGTASGAPQQTVVNGWLARDLMEVQIKQNNAELVLLHLGLAVLIAGLLAIVIAGTAAAYVQGPPEDTSDFDDDDERQDSDESRLRSPAHAT